MTSLRDRNFALHALLYSQTKSILEEEVNTFETILDIASNKENVVGIHITGGEIGNALNRGIELTGHKWVARDTSDYRSNIRGTLEKNISFFENRPIELAMNLINARGYNNTTQDFNDIMIVSIPKKELEQNQEGIITEKDEVRYLNPSYIKGFVKVRVKDGKIEGFQENPRFAQKEIKEHETVKELSTEDWKEKFEGWYEQSRTTKMQKFKVTVLKFFKNIINKDKEKEINDEKDI